MRALARRARVVVVCASLAVGGTVAAVPGTASATGAEQSITVFLKAADGAALDRLAALPGPVTAARRAALDRALPSAAAQRQVEESLRSRGFTVTDVSSWSVTAKAPAGVVGALFGLASSVTGLLSRIPALLGGHVSVAFQNGVGERAVRPHALTGTDFRNAYTSSGLTAARIAPYTGHYRGARPTIATIQFTGWDRNDLAEFARHNGLPYNSSTLTEVPVNQSSVPRTGKNGEPVEVALDQEAILATNPYAHQRAYFAPNNDSGFTNAFSKVLDDVRGNSHAYKGGDRHITALSVSWGACESSGSASVTAANQIIKSLVAAGVTVFAASGDSGAFDCGKSGIFAQTPKPGADFPASSPYVVGVGGTSLSRDPGGPNNGHNWLETAWSCSNASACSGGLLAIGGGTGGSGGGTSARFARPSYQSGISGSGRMVPDIAGEADPINGLDVYTSDPAGPWVTVGGTSLAAPTQAALFTNMLSAHGYAKGVGDIHAKLYAAARTPGTFRDITEGTNYYEAKPGYDLVTGLGAPLWPAIGRRLFGTSPLKPTIRWSASGHATRRPVTLRWASGKRGLLLSITVRTASGSFVTSRAAAAPSGHLSFRGQTGKRYVATITVTDTSHRISLPRKYAFVVRR